MKEVYEMTVNSIFGESSTNIWSFQLTELYLLPIFGILLLLEATRRAIGVPLVTIATIFILFSIFGQSMPELISHQGLSLKRLIGYHRLGGEAIFGIPISVCFYYGWYY